MSSWHESYETPEEQKVPEFEIITPTEESDPRLFAFARAVLDGTEGCIFSSEFREARREERKRQIEEGS